MKDINDSEILEVFRESEMRYEISKIFADESIPDFEKDFISMVRKCISKCKEEI